MPMVINNQFELLNSVFSCTPSQSDVEIMNDKNDNISDECMESKLRCTLYDITNNRIWKLYYYLALNTLNSVIEDFESPINEINKKIIDCKGSNQI